MDFINTCFETTNDVRLLAYYAHLVPLATSLLLGFVAFKYAKDKSKSVLFLLFTILLSLWLVGNLITWTSNDYYNVAAFWSVLDYLNILFYLALLCFVCIDFSKKSRVPILIVSFSVIASLFPFLLTFIGLSVHQFDEPNCEMYGNELLAQYKLLLEWVVILSILAFGMYSGFRKKANVSEVKRISLITISSVTFLGLFSSTEYISTLTDIYEINLYALFALPIFLLIFTYTIIEQKTFILSLKSIWFVRMLFIIFMIVGVSNLLIVESKLQLLTTAASTIVTLGFGVLVLRSASRESEQKEEIEKLAVKLEKANERLKVLDKMKSEFVSIASHQLRSPLTAIRGYSSMLLEGSFGKLPQKAVRAIANINESGRFMASSVEDYLNVSRIQAGNMKYEYSDFNIAELVTKVADDNRILAIKKGLLLTFKSSLTKKGVVHADIGKTRQVIDNLVNNSLKYTLDGSISVHVHDAPKTKKVFVSIADTGIGMDQNTCETLFEKFERANNANDVNVTGTGLGLYIARKMAREMGGDITVTSNGEGEGSTFTLELPLKS